MASRATRKCRGKPSATCQRSIRSYSGSSSDSMASGSSAIHSSYVIGVGLRASVEMRAVPSYDVTIAVAGRGRLETAPPSGSSLLSSSATGSGGGSPEPPAMAPPPPPGGGGRRPSSSVVNSTLLVVSSDSSSSVEEGAFPPARRCASRRRRRAICRRAICRARSASRRSASTLRTPRPRSRAESRSIGRPGLVPLSKTLGRDAGAGAGAGAGVAARRSRSRISELSSCSGSAS